MPVLAPLAPALLGMATLLTTPPACAESVVVAGHATLHVPSTITVLTEPLQDGHTGGDVVPVERQLVVLSTQDRHPRATLILNATSGGRIVQWLGGCEGMKSDKHLFVRHPFHVGREECVYVAGPFDLDRSIDSFAPGALAKLKAMGLTMPQGGYIAHATFALESGQMLRVDAFLPLPFEGLPGVSPADVDGSGLPPALIAWALSFGEQVRKAMLTVSGDWQLPPLE